MSRPLGHMVGRDPSGVGHSDSCLHAAGGYSIEMNFWWYIEWPESVRRQTLKYVKNDKNNTLISINVLEYAAGIIEFIAALHYFKTYHTDKTDPHPTVLLYADNTTAESWLLKGCKSSMIGRSLGRLQCSLMINSPVGLYIDHVTTKDNKIADRISRIKSETDVSSYYKSLVQDFPQLASCRRFHPSAELTSSIIALLLRKKSQDPLEVRGRILADLGRSTI